MTVWSVLLNPFKYHRAASKFVNTWSYMLVSMSSSVSWFLKISLTETRVWTPVPLCSWYWGLPESVKNTISCHGGGLTDVVPVLILFERNSRNSHTIHHKIQSYHSLGPFVLVLGTSWLRLRKVSCHRGGLTYVNPILCLLCENSSRISHITYMMTHCWSNHLQHEGGSVPNWFPLDILCKSILLHRAIWLCKLRYCCRRNTCSPCSLGFLICGGWGLTA